MYLRTNGKSVLSANNQWILKFPCLISKGFVLKPRCDPELGFSSVCRLPCFSFEVERSLPTPTTHTSFSECWFLKRPGHFPYYSLDLMTASLWSQLNHIPAPYIFWKLEVRSKALTIQCLIPHTASRLEVWKVKGPHSGKVWISWSRCWLPQKGLFHLQLANDQRAYTLSSLQTIFTQEPLEVMVLICE